MPVSRMRMRPWLVQMIESKSVSGLEWIDQDKTTFTIPWKHAARHGWKLETDACLFQQWAVHTGKHTKGQTEDPKTWKANFRCALNSLPDIEEVKDRSVNKGHHAMRVFKMLPPAFKSRDKRTNGKKAKTSRRKSSDAASVSSPSHSDSSWSPCSSTKTDEEMDSSDARSSADESVLEEEVNTQENVVDSSSSYSGDRPSIPGRGSAADICSSLLPATAVWKSCFDQDCGDPGGFLLRLQVSPEHYTDFDDCDDEIVQICKELEKMENEAFRDGCKSYSPIESPSSDSSMADSDDVPLYTTLGSQLLFPPDWSTSSKDLFS